jgi:hypothetical protein
VHNNSRRSKSERMVEHNRTPPRTDAAVNNNGSELEEREIIFKAEGWATATFSSVSLPSSTYGGARSNHPTQVNHVLSSDSVRYKSFPVPGQNNV